MIVPNYSETLCELLGFNLLTLIETFPTLLRPSLRLSGIHRPNTAPYHPARRSRPSHGSNPSLSFRPHSPPFPFYRNRLLAYPSGPCDPHFPQRLIPREIRWCASHSHGFFRGRSDRLVLALYESPRSRRS